MTKPQGSAQEWLAALRTDGKAFASAIAQRNALTQQVGSCPGWSVADLAAHLASVYDFVRTGVTWGALTAPGSRRTDPTPPAAPDIADQWVASFQAMVTHLENCDPRMPAWNWAPCPKIAEFWFRRMAHETAIHRWDAQMAVGIPDPLGDFMAADGLAEVLDTWLPAGRGHPDKKTPHPGKGMIALHATDLDEAWYIRLRERGLALLDDDALFDEHDHHERVSASGTISDLVLAVWGRVPFSVLDLAGDARLLEGLRIG